MDSIIRQSRHQFGPEKDVFAPRFTKNINKTFTNLFKCDKSDRVRMMCVHMLVPSKSTSLPLSFYLSLSLFLSPSFSPPLSFSLYLQGKIVRVLNLWQKNGIYAPDVIQPLLGLVPAASMGGDSDSSPTHMPMSVEPEPVHPPPMVPEPMMPDPIALDPVAIISNQQQQITELLKQQQQEQIIELLQQQQQQLQSMLHQSRHSGVSTAAISNLLEKSQQLQTLQTKLAQGVTLQPLTTNNVYSGGHQHEEQHTLGMHPSGAMMGKPVLNKSIPGEFNKVSIHVGTTLS